MSWSTLIANIHQVAIFGNSLADRFFRGEVFWLAGFRAWGLSPISTWVVWMGGGVVVKAALHAGVE
jgi:hypothetical protein